jgi:hypothetical protein
MIDLQLLWEKQLKDINSLTEEEIEILKYLEWKEYYHIIEDKNGLKLKKRMQSQMEQQKSVRLKILFVRSLKTNLL